MNRRSFLLTLAILFVFAGGSCGALVSLLRHEPSFYRARQLPPGENRVQWSNEFQSEFANRLLGGILSEQEWKADFAENELNSYFQEDFVGKHAAESPLPAGVTEPRVSLEPERIRLGFRYGRGIWSTVITIDIRPWLVIQEPNVLALEFRAMHAGAIPISAQWLLESLAEAARQHNIEVSYYRYNRNPVVVLRFQANRNHPTFQIREFKIGQGVVRITGRPIER